MAMKEDALLDRKGLYGKHPKLEKLVEEVEGQNRGATSTELKSKLGTSKQTFDKIAAQAHALGMVDVTGGGKGSNLRLFYTPNKQLLFTPGTSQQEIEDQMVEALDEITNDEGVQDATYRISIQKIEE